MRIFCIDPGPHVGVACWTNTPGVEFETEGFEAWEWTPEQFYSQVEAWVDASDVVVCEGFRISGPRASEGNVTIEMIGVLRFLCFKQKKRLEVQEPGAYKFAGSDKLRRLGWYTPGSDHARSASGHLVKFLAEHNLIDRARLLPSNA